MPEPNAARGATEAAPRVEYELQLYYWMKLIRVKMGCSVPESPAASPRASTPPI